MNSESLSQPTKKESNMSKSNKNKFFQVTTISSVSAKNMEEARRAASSRTKVVGTEVLGRATTVDRLYAQDARELGRTLSEG